MKNIFPSAINFIYAEEGASAVEYGVLIALISVAIIAIVMIVGLQIEAAFNKVCKVLANVTAVAC